MRRSLLIIAFLLFFIGGKAFAGTTYTWTGLGFNSNWTTAANWFPSSGYPGSGGSTTDIAVINTSLLSVNLNTSLTISQLTTTSFGLLGIGVNFTGSSPTLTITNGLSIAQPLFALYAITFSGTGTALIGGTSSFAYAASMAVSTGATVNFSTA